MKFALNGWYCAAYSTEVGEKPIARYLLDFPVMLLRDDQNNVVALGDRCPHRFAPLHMGLRTSDAIECPYHGLRFDFDGKCAFNPHGSGAIPKTASVPKYVVTECQGVVWIWLGDPEGADPSHVPDLQLIDQDGRNPLCGHIEMDVDYQLILDNLLDLSHSMFLHRGVLSPAAGTRETKTVTSDRSILVSTMMRYIPTPASQAFCYEKERGDFSSNIEWLFPSILRHTLSIRMPGEIDESDGALNQNAHLITPAQNGRTHYFWIHTRNRNIGNENVDEMKRNIMQNAFVNEDEAMIKKCQEYMGGEDFFSLDPIYLETDRAGIMCRRIIQAAIDLERNT